MHNLIFSIATQSLTLFPLAFAISISYYLLRATDMTIDGSFVLGAAIFARLTTMHFSPALATVIALSGGALAGVFVACIQRNGRVEPLLAGVLATFVLSSLNLIIMGKPNINLLSLPTLVSKAFEISDEAGWSLVAVYSLLPCLIVLILLKSQAGLILRAFGDNPTLLLRLRGKIECYRMGGFALTNTMAALAGVLTAQTVGYADIGMGFGITLTGIGTVILGQQLFYRFIKKKIFRAGMELLACFIGVTLYLFSLNFLLRLEVNPLYLKMILGLLLISFLRMAIKPLNRDIP